MATLNISLPEQLRQWVAEQVSGGQYSSASDYLRDLIRTDQRKHQQHLQWLEDHLRPLVDTDETQFIQLSSNDIKTKMRHKIEASS